ncbi:hypothetical protein FALBO_827 [Fusarium albosuccineum]|uniref:Uncharacterized protein n=1 Tax=Fusarium albosuccineum TaxID=1237068 RepID=A0A8H4PI18_9HYPO|nr:hypothetical protein FALBO_827 [Fusarium albosuccineum]
MTNGAVNNVDLDKILQAGANKVVQSYTSFRTIFPKRSMMEVGLTDTFMMGAQAYAAAYHLDASLDWYTQENITGCDFGITVNQNQQNGPKDIYFQAKVAKRDKLGIIYADFLYESTRKIGRQTVLNYQNILLADYAKANNAEAYYVIFDANQVYWVNALYLKNYFDKTPAQAGQSDTLWCIKAWQKLAYTTFLDAKNKIPAF